MRQYLLIDVGGTGLKSAIMDENGTVLSSAQDDSSCSRDSQEAIFANLATVLTRRQRDATAPLTGIAMAWPGPFDYDKGISSMRGQDKYDSIYGLSVAQGLLDALHARGETWADGLPMRFGHDLVSFARGQVAALPQESVERAIHLCIGTGTGSAFTRGRSLLGGGDGVPPDGWIYPLPFRDGTVDDYISARGLAAIAQRQIGKPLTGKELSLLAHQHDQGALSAFHTFGEDILEALMPHLLSFHPDVVLLGGQIARSAAFFEGPLASFCQGKGMRVLHAGDTSLSIMRGLLALLQEA